jgi:hypothetical protein
MRSSFSNFRFGFRMLFKGLGLTLVIALSLAIASANAVFSVGNLLTGRRFYGRDGRDWEFRRGGTWAVSPGTQIHQSYLTKTFR